MKRSDIRYALFRCKNGTQTPEQQAIFDSFKSQLDPYDYGIEEFTKEWDVDKSDLTQVVTGKLAKKYNQDKSLFTSEGVLKD